MIVGNLTAKHIGAKVRLQHEGWVHTGTLVSLQFNSPWTEGELPRVLITIRYESKAAWSKVLDYNYEVDVREAGGKNVCEDEAGTVDLAI